MPGRTRPANIRQCQGISRKDGLQCRARALLGFNFCAKHGGGSMPDVLSPNFKPGLYSHKLPVGLAREYQDMLVSPELSSVESDLALVTARIVDLANRTDIGESRRLWTGVNTALREYDEARHTGDITQAEQALTELHKVVRAGMADWATWREITDMTEQRRKLVETHQRLEANSQATITIEAAMALIGHLLDSVRRHVQDRAAFAQIATEFARLTGGDDIQGPERVELAGSVCELPV